MKPWFFFLWELWEAKNEDTRDFALWEAGNKKDLMRFRTQEKNEGLIFFLVGSQKLQDQSFALWELWEAQNENTRDRDFIFLFCSFALWEPWEHGNKKDLWDLVLWTLRTLWTQEKMMTYFFFFKKARESLVELNTEGLPRWSKQSQKGSNFGLCGTIFKLFVSNPTK